MSNEYASGAPSLKKWKRWAQLANGRRATPRLYNTWLNMLKRCERPSNCNYYHYGARGISVCAEWHDYAVFRAWAIANGYRKGITLDRYPDQDGNYGPDNCRWATREQRTYNAASVKKLTLNGVTKLLPIWAKEMGVPPHLLRSRLRDGWTHEQVLTNPHRQWREGVVHQKRGRKAKVPEQRT